ncbi:MAG: bifunctional DNA primase/polymerase [Candidatus Nanopelagicales bacterium]
MAVDISGEAVRLAQMGFDVFPLKVWSKLPATTHGFKDATSDVGEVASTWARMADANVAIRTGMYGDRCLVVIDLDEHVAGISGPDAWAELTARHGCPDTVESLTPSNGRHLYFWFPSEIRNSAGTLMPAGIDVRGEGGYVVAPPSALATDGVYEWEASSDPNDGIAIAEAPQWLVDRLTAEPPRQEPRRERKKYTGNPRPGDLWAASTTWPELLEADGAVYLETRTHTTHGNYEVWARPGCITDHGSLHPGATLYFAGSDVLKVHTSRWPDLDEESTYTKIGYLAATKFNGDVGAAARWCSGQGFKAPEVDMRDWLSAPPSDPTNGEHEAPDAPEQSLADKIRARILTPAQLRDLPPPQPLIDGILDLESLAVLYGPSGQFKTFLALDWGLSVATGSWWRGRRVEKSNVLYIAGEGASGVWARLDAWAAYQKLHHLPDGFMTLPIPINLMTSAIVEALAEVAVSVNAKFIILDTLARMAVGADENSAKDMGLLVDQADYIKRQTGACVIPVHHAGKDVERGMRGSTALYGAADTVIACSAAEDEVRLEVVKQKNHAAGIVMTFRPEPIRDSIVLTDTTYNPSSAIPDSVLRLLIVLSEIVVDGGTPATQWFASAGIAERSFYRHRKTLIDLGYIHNVGSERLPRYIITEQGFDWIARNDTKVLPNERGSDRNLTVAVEGVTATPLPKSERAIEQAKHAPLPVTATGCHDSVAVLPPSHPPYRGGRSGSPVVMAEQNTHESTPLDPINNPADRNPANWNFIDDEPLTLYAQEPT